MKHYTLTLNGSAQEIGAALIAAGDTEGTLNDDHGFRFLSFTAGDGNSAAVKVGDADLASGDWGLWVPKPDADGNVAQVTLGHYDAGPLKLSAIYALGTNGEKLHIAGIPF